MIHPLLDTNSKHYNKGDKPTIYDIECMLTLQEMIGACKFNIHKYTNRDKQQDELDAIKAQRYTNYKNFLEKCKRKYNGNKNTTCRIIIDKLYPKLEYNI